MLKYSVGLFWEGEGGMLTMGLTMLFTLKVPACEAGVGAKKNVGIHFLSLVCDKIINLKL